VTSPLNDLAPLPLAQHPLKNSQVIGHSKSSKNKMLSIAKQFMLLAFMLLANAIVGIAYQPRDSRLILPTDIGSRGKVSRLELTSTTVGAEEAQCLDLVVDCGAKANGKADDTAAFAVCQSKIEHARLQDSTAATVGCVTVPRGHYRCIGVALTTSHVAWSVAAGTVFSPPVHVAVSRQGPLFLVGSQTKKDSRRFSNITVAGCWPGKFVVDVSKPLAGSLAGLRQGAFMFRGGLTGFGVHNLEVRLPGQSNAGIANALVGCQSAHRLRLFVECGADAVINTPLV
jgi:hypothetical protein